MQAVLAGVPAPTLWMRAAEPTQAGDGFVVELIRCASAGALKEAVEEVIHPLEGLSIGEDMGRADGDLILDKIG